MILKTLLREGEMNHLIDGLQYVLDQCNGKQQHACIAAITRTANPGQDGIDPELDAKVEEVAAGNSGTDRRHSPAGIEGAITVGALDNTDQVTKFSNFGNQVDIWAMGTPIIGLFTGDIVPILVKQWWARGRTGGEIHADGTSYASAQVVGIIALIISAHGKNMSPERMKEKVIEMGMKDRIPNLNRQPFKYYGPNVIAHISKQIYDAA
ncbi:hypothetical protein H0H93_002120 [Arthromyces matolae]|nr:hypothetical protein H0H93_002120 [Arthromyces matolae]